MNALAPYLSRIEWKVAIKTGLSAGIALFLGLLLSHYFQRPDTIISGMWSTLAAIVVQQGHLGSTYQSAWIRFMGVLIGCGMGGLFTTLMGSNPVSLCFSIMITVVVCSLFGLKDSVRISCLSVAVVMVLWGLRPSTSPWMFGFFRFLDSCLGISVAVLIAHILWPAQVSAKIKKSVADTFQHFIKLFSWAVYMKPLSESENKIFAQLSQETERLLRKNQQYLNDSKLELLSKGDELEEWNHLFGHMEMILERIYALKTVYKIHLEAIIDSNLSRMTNQMILLTENTLQNFAAKMENTAPLKDLAVLDRASEELGAELIQFRSKRKTGQFDLKDVEGFFVFFYSLRALVAELQKIHKHLSLLL